MLLLGAVTQKPACVGKRQEHQVFGVQLPKCSLTRLPFVETVCPIAPGPLGVEQRGYRMPRMPLHARRCGMVTRNDEDIRLLRDYRRNALVQPFQNDPLSMEPP